MNKRREEGDLKPWEKFEIRQYREAGASIRNIAGLFRISMATVYRALAEMRGKFGPEKIHSTRRQHARPTLRSNLRGHDAQVDTAEKRR